jgi:CheY-like chemotaxis protein
VARKWNPERENLKNNMTNAAVLDILNHLCNEARNSVHATFGVMELLPPSAADPTWQAYMDISRSSADRLLGSIDDFRDLLSSPLPASDTVEEFDLGLCLGEIIELVNLASQNPASHIFLEAPLQPLPVRQHRKSVEHLLTRILDSASKLTTAGDIYVSASVDTSGDAVGFTITPPGSGLAVRLADWLNTDPGAVSFRDLPDMPVSLAVLVAGKMLRVLEGTTQLVCEPGVPTHLATFLPSLSKQSWEQPDQEAQPSSLNVLLTEDCDDSYALSELMLRKENVWRAHDGEEAIDMVKKQRFDIVLMDVHMGGMDGYTAIRAIREWETGSGNARTPIVILSSDDLDTQRHSAARAGCTGYLRKPLRNNDLPDLLDRLKDARSLAM